MKNIQDTVKVPLQDAKGFRLFRPGTWSMKYRSQVLNLITTLVTLLAIIMLVFFVQRRSVVRNAASVMKQYTNAKASHLEDYFRSVSNQLSVFSADANTLEAMKAFSQAVNSIEGDQYTTESAASLDEMNSALKGFYSSEVIPALTAETDESYQPESFLSDDNRQNILQFLYLADNTRTLSQKYVINRASDGSLYSEFHSRFHPGMLAFARQVGLSDILLLDYKTGCVVYSMKKNIDFGTDVYEGPFSSSAMADAYRAAVTTPASGIVRFTDESLYLPAFMQPTVFFSAPVYEGNQLLGAILFALDINTFDRLLSTGTDDNEPGISCMKTFLIGPDLSYRSNDPDLITDPEQYMQNLRKKGDSPADADEMARLKTTALVQKVDYQKFSNAFDLTRGTLSYQTATGENAFCSYKLLDNTAPQWMLCTRMEKTSLFTPLRRMMGYMSLLSVVLLVVVFYTGRYFNWSVYEMIARLRSSLLGLKGGNTGIRIDTDLNNELGQVAEAYNQLAAKMDEMLTFISEISRENFEAEWNFSSEQDGIGRTLNELKENLMLKKSEEIKQKGEEHIRSWSSQGIALFNDILRKDNDNLEKLSLNVIRHLIEYLKANQGGLFLLDEEEKEKKLHLVASIAFDRQKFHKKTIEEGEGLTGACIMEKQTILLNKIPDDYIEITSGLGGARPGSLIIVPLKKEDTVYGVIELASFNPFQEHEVEFAEKVAENITDTITNVRLNLENMQLLEKFMLQEEEMKAQDEELRQNIEELQTTHEQMDRIKEDERGKTDKLIKEIEDNRNLLLNVLDQIPGKIFVKDHNGVLLLLNSEVARVYNKKVDELIGTSDFDNHPHDEATVYRAKELEILEKGGETYIQEESLTGEMRYLKTTKMPFYMPHLDKTGLLGFQIDVTDQVTLEEKIAKLTAELDALRKKLKDSK